MTMLRSVAVKITVPTTAGLASKYASLPAKSLQLTLDSALALAAQGFGPSTSATELNR